MKCPFCDKPIPRDLIIKEAASAMQKRGLKKRAYTSEQARKAVQERWRRYRENKKSTGNRKP